MRKKLLCALIGIFVLLLIILLFDFFFQGKEPSEDPSQYHYVLKEYGGKLAVFPYGSTTPSQVLDVYLRTLPSYDRDALASGIEVRDEQELQKLLEDYTS